VRGSGHRSSTETIAALLACGVGLGAGHSRAVTWLTVLYTHMHLVWIAYYSWSIIQMMLRW